MLTANTSYQLRVACAVHDNEFAEQRLRIQETSSHRPLLLPPCTENNFSDSPKSKKAN